MAGTNHTHTQYPVRCLAGHGESQKLKKKKFGRIFPDKKMKKWNKSEKAKNQWVQLANVRWRWHSDQLCVSLLGELDSPNSQQRCSATAILFRVIPTSPATGPFAASAVRAPSFVPTADSPGTSHGYLYLCALFGEYRLAACASNIDSRTSNTTASYCGLLQRHWLQ